MPPKKRASNQENGASAPKLNKTSSDYGALNFECVQKSKEGKEFNFKISSWNVNGLRAWIEKGGLDFLKYEKPDVLCLQEIKCSEDKLPPEIKVCNYRIHPIISRPPYINRNIWLFQINIALLRFIVLEI